MGSLSWLDLGQNNLGPKGLQHILQALPEGMTRLVLDHNRFHTSSAAALSFSNTGLPVTSQ